MIELKFIVDNLWILISALLVFIMHLGFSTLESGLTQAKNTVNILFKNVSIIAIIDDIGIIDSIDNICIINMINIIKSLPSPSRKASKSQQTFGGKF